MYVRQMTHVTSIHNELRVPMSVPWGSVSTTEWPMAISRRGVLISTVGLLRYASRQSCLATPSLQLLRYTHCNHRKVGRR